MAERTTSGSRWAYCRVHAILGRASITVLDLPDNAETIQVYVVTPDAVPALGVHCDLAKLTLRFYFYGEAGIVCLGCRLPLQDYIVSINQSPKCG